MIPLSLTRTLLAWPSHSIISMPALSPTMTAGNIGTWQKNAGDKIEPGEVLVEIETDKAQMDFEFQDDGVLAKILKDSGEKDVPVGNPIAVMVESEDDVAAFKDFTVEDAGGDAAKKDQEPSESESEEKAASAQQGQKQSEEAPAKEEKKEPEPAAAESQSTGERLGLALDREPGLAPAAKKLALEKGVSIKDIKGSGPGGRITKKDIENYKPSASAPAAAPAGAPAGAPTYEDLEVSGMRKTIASRLKQSMQENPHYFVASSVSASKLLKLRQALNGAADGKYKLSVNDFLIKAIAIAARKVPAANSSWIEEGKKVIIRQHNVVDVSVAVATPTGLITPIVKNVNGTGLEAISSQIKDLGKRARDNKLKAEEYQGGTITISNMGMNDAVERFTAVINPPQATIVAVGSVKKVAIPKESGIDGEVVGFDWDEQIVLTGSFDHKVVDGAVGGEFMKELKKVIENPLELML